jgi:putative membrane protein
MVAFPIARRGSTTRQVIAHAVVAGLATTTTATTMRRWGAGRAVLGASLVSVGTAAVEAVGTATGVPFGRYRYTGRLRPTAAGVPVVVPLAWWAMAVPARETAHAALGPRARRVTRIGLGAVALTAWDLFLDPQMTAEGFWRWTDGGRYRGIPASNFAGWLLTSAAVMAVLELALPPSDADPALVGEYAAMGVMETVGFGGFFGDRLVAAAGAAAMLPVAALAAVRFLSPGAR